MPSRPFVVLLGTLTIAAVLGSALTACGDDDGPQLPSAGSAYIEAVRWVVDQPQYARDIEEDVLAVVFVDPIGQGELSLEVQAEVVDVMAVDDNIDVRFVDDPATVIDHDEPAAPVQDNGVLIGLGSLPESSPFELRVEVYITTNVVHAFRFGLRRAGDRWERSGEPEPVDPEGLVEPVDG